MEKITLKDFSTDNIPTQKQVDNLAQFLLENFEDKMGRGNSPGGEGAIEMAVRLLLKQIYDEKKDVYVFWKDETGEYHAFPTRDFKKPTIKEEDGCWSITIKKKNV